MTSINSNTPLATLGQRVSCHTPVEPDPFRPASLANARGRHRACSAVGGECPFLPLQAAAHGCKTTISRALVHTSVRHASAPLARLACIAYHISDFALYQYTRYAYSLVYGNITHVLPTMQCHSHACSLARLTQLTLLCAMPQLSRVK